MSAQKPSIVLLYRRRAVSFFSAARDLEQLDSIGVIEIVEMAGDEIGANVRLAAERFPTPAYEMASAYSSTHEAQIQFGG